MFSRITNISFRNLFLDSKVTITISIIELACSSFHRTYYSQEFKINCPTTEYSFQILNSESRFVLEKCIHVGNGTAFLIRIISSMKKFQRILFTFESSYFDTT